MIKPGQNDISITTPPNPKPMEVVDLTTGVSRMELPSYVPNDNERIVLPTTDVTATNRNALWWILGLAAAYYAFK